MRLALVFAAVALIAGYALGAAAVRIIERTFRP
jgi:uncharacterized membrane-anchored protein YhcB (DUF1043 family)